MNTEKPLTMLQIKALELLLQGQSISAAAREANVHRSTIHNWCQQESAFRQALEEGRHQIRQNLEHTALATLQELLEDPNTAPALKIRASLALLKLLPTAPIRTQNSSTQPAQPEQTEPLTTATQIPKNEPGAPARNRPCPCGSTIKYKRCCLLKPPTARAA